MATLGKAVLWTLEKNQMKKSETVLEELVPNDSFLILTPELSEAGRAADRSIPYGSWISEEIKTKASFSTSRICV